MNKTGNKEAGMYPPRLHWHAHRILRVVAMLPLKLPGGGLWSCQGASVPVLFRAQKEPVSSDRTGIVIPFLSSENTGSCRFYDFRSGSDCRMDDKSDSLKSQQQFLMEAVSLNDSPQSGEQFQTSSGKKNMDCREAEECNVYVNVCSPHTYSAFTEIIIKLALSVIFR